MNTICSAGVAAGETPTTLCLSRNVLLRALQVNFIIILNYTCIFKDFFFNFPCVKFALLFFPHIRWKWREKNAQHYYTKSLANIRMQQFLMKKKNLCSLKIMLLISLVQGWGYGSNWSGSELGIREKKNSNRILRSDHQLKAGSGSNPWNLHEIGYDLIKFSLKFFYFYK